VDHLHETVVLNVVSGLFKQVQFYVTVSSQDKLGWFLSPPPQIYFILLFLSYFTVIHMNYKKDAPNYAQLLENLTLNRTLLWMSNKTCYIGANRGVAGGQGGSHE
jgi:heme/copper-type cytochrome/quinol oxidase subunit 3